MTRPLFRRWHALVLVVPCAVAMPALADSSKPPPKPTDPNEFFQRPKHWWLDIYAHTMQEQAFLRWMDARYTPQWRHTMQESLVDQHWRWWTVHIWRLRTGAEPPA